MKKLNGIRIEISIIKHLYQMLQLKDFTLIIL